MDEILLMLPGPTTVHLRVLNAYGLKPAVNHNKCVSAESQIWGKS